LRKALLLCLAGTLFAQSKLATVNEAGYQKLIASHKGKVLLVDFWATWCKPCRAEMPALVALDNKLRARGFQLVTVSADEPEQEQAALKLLKDFSAPQPAFRRQAANDEKFINSVDDKWSGALPALFLYDRNGRKVRSFIGETPAKDIEAAIEKVL
jgi:thiol-disulfide isomerase/thioredoxin